MHHAACWGHTASVKALVELPTGCLALFTEDDQGRPPLALALAVEDGHSATVEPWLPPEPAGACCHKSW